MNDLSGTVRDRRSRSCYCFSSCDPIPRPVLCVVASLFLVGLAVSAFILAVVHNAVLLVLLLVLAALVLVFLLWNAYSSVKNGAVLLFLDRFPDSDLLTAKDGQLVKITGLISRGNLSLESSYEKVTGCVYTSTLLYEYTDFGSKPACAKCRCFQWNLAYSERFAADFYITDIKSGIRAMVKAGYNSKVTSLINENTLVRTTSKNRILSSNLMKWLGERNLSAEARLLRLEEGYVKEGSSLTVMGMVSRSSGVLMIVPLLEPISTGCLLQKFLLPMDVDGLVLGFSDGLSSMANPHLPQNPTD